MTGDSLRQDNSCKNSLKSLPKKYIFAHLQKTLMYQGIFAVPHVDIPPESLLTLAGYFTKECEK